MTLILYASEKNASEKNASEKKFIDKNINILISSYLSNRDIISLIGVNKRLRTDLFSIPYKSFKFNWWADVDVFKTFLNHTNNIEQLTINRYEFFQHYMVRLPKLKKITLLNCELPDLNILELYSSTLKDIYIESCSIHNSSLNMYKFPKLEKITIDSFRDGLKTEYHLRSSWVIFETKPVTCLVLEII